MEYFNLGVRFGDYFHIHTNFNLSDPGVLNSTKSKVLKSLSNKIDLKQMEENHLSELLKACEYIGLNVIKDESEKIYEHIMDALMPKDRTLFSCGFLVTIYSRQLTPSGSPKLMDIKIKLIESLSQIITTDKASMIFNEYNKVLFSLSDQELDLRLLSFETSLTNADVKSIRTLINKNIYQSLNYKIFIVHGHDDAVKYELARFLEKLGFEAIILHEQANNGRTIIESLESNTDVGYAIILYTPCDVGKSINEVGLKQRARQNVVFEHGYLMGKLGRKNVCALVKGDVERPSDISGVVYIKMDINGSWKIDLCRNMQSVGYDLDINKIL